MSGLLIDIICSACNILVKDNKLRTGKKGISTVAYGLKCQKKAGKNALLPNVAQFIEHGMHFKTYFITTRSAVIKKSYPTWST